MTGKMVPFLLLIVNNTYDREDKYEYYGKSKVCININQVDHCSTSSLRIVDMVTNRIRVISERSDDSECDEFYSDIVDWIPSHVLQDAEMLIEYMKNILATTTDDLVEERYRNLRKKGTLTPIPKLPV